MLKKVALHAPPRLSRVYREHTMQISNNVEPFAIKDSALMAIATGKRAQNLRELAELLRDINPDSIYYHFWGGLLRPRFDNPEYHNDFAIWAANSLHDKILAERLGVIDPTDFDNLEELRQELIDVIEEFLDEKDIPLWAKRDDQFEFIRSQIVVFDTRKVVAEPQGFRGVLPTVSLGTIFYHFIDARQRNQDAVDDFRNWLIGFGARYEALCERVKGIDPYFAPLARLRDELTDVFTEFFQG